MAGFDLDSKLADGNSAPKSEILGDQGRETQETFDIGKPDIFEESPGRQFLNKTRKGAQTEASSLYGRDTGELGIHSRTNNRELFDVEEGFGANTESTEIRLSAKPNGNAGTLAHPETANAGKERPKNKTDTFLITQMDAEVEKKQTAILNTDLRRKPDRGGSHNFNLISQQYDKEADFTIEVHRQPEATQAQPFFEIPEKHDSSDEEDRSSVDSREYRRDAGEVDFDF